MGLISKRIINSIVRAHNQVNKWKNSYAVIDWFKNLGNKQSLCFLTFDIVDFYPSISETLLTNSLNYASQFVNIPEEDRRSLLFDKENPWAKRNNASLFDVSMGS